MPMGKRGQEMQKRTALIVGSTGVVGQNLARRLVDGGWDVFGLSRGRQVVEGVHGLAADLQDAGAVRDVLRGLDISDVFLSAWIRHDTEAENVRVNGAIVKNIFEGLSDAKNLRHAALVTGTKQYLGPFESYGQTGAETPFREDTPRLPGENFYYTQEDVLFVAAARMGFGWSVHRPHTIVGYAVGNAMNMGSTLAVYATLCRETGAAFVFPGSTEQWNALTDMTDARLLAEHLEWASTSPAGRDQAFNVVNGDIFRWRWMWSQLAEYFGLKPEGPPAEGAPLEPRMGHAAEAWKQVVKKYGLVESDVNRLASWWHTDGDLGRKIECVNDMSKNRRLGFTTQQDTVRSFYDLFDRMKQERLIPA
jgi:nucleoside-diphosphate-sugar epimerase